MPIKINEQITIADWEYREEFLRSSGPGGQNVNKVATAVSLRFEAARSPHLPDWVKLRLQKLAGRQLTKDGALVFYCDETRHQIRNRALVRDRLVALIRRALERPKKRIATRPSKGAIERRLKAKKKRGAIKETRRGSHPDGDLH